jgi:hypothetical protein
LNKTHKIFLVFIIFVSSFFRIIPFFNDLGSDFYSTLESYPKEIANGYGFYYVLGDLFGKINLPFIIFWFFSSFFLSISFYIYISNTNFSGIKKYGIDYFIVVFFVLGFIIPWFSFQNYRFGAALLLLTSTLGKTIKKSVIKITIAVSIHSLCVIFIPFLFIKKQSKIVFVFLSSVILFLVYVNLEFITQITLKYIGYENYLSDFEQFSDNKVMNWLVYVRLSCLIYCGYLLIKKEYYSGLFSFIAIYVLSVLFTPFYGRLTPFIYLYIIIGMKREFSWGKVVFLFLLLIDSYFSITKSIFHYGV